jgi:EmrB/QacA subfamily drug resistance transporter
MQSSKRGTTLASAPAADGTLDRALRPVLAALIIGSIAPILDSTIVTIALRRLAEALNMSLSAVQWVSTGYLLALAVAIPVTGWVQSRLGGKRAWVLALTIFGAGSVLCAAAWNGPSLIGFRVLQGFGAGLIFPLMQTLATQAAKGKITARVVATISMPLALGPILGPVLGGIVLNWLDWRWLFLINVPVIAVALILAHRYLPAGDTSAKSPRTALDTVGLILVAPGLVGTLLGLSNVAQDNGFGHPDVLIPLLSGLILLALFVLWAVKHAGRALIDIRLLSRRSLASASAVLSAAGAALYAGMFLLPLYWQEVRGDGVLTAAVLLLPQGVGALLSRTVAAKLTDRVGARSVTIGAFVLAAAATAPFALATAHTSTWWLGAVLLVRGFGIGAVLIPPLTVAYRDIAPPEIPHATMTTRITQQVGASFGIAIAAVTLQTQLSHDVVGAFHQAFWWSVGITLAALIPAAFLPGRDSVLA